MFQSEWNWQVGWPGWKTKTSWAAIAIIQARNIVGWTRVVTVQIVGFGIYFEGRDILIEYSQ